MNYLLIYLIALPIIFIVGFFIYLKNKRKWLTEDKIEVSFDAGKKLEELNQKVLSLIKRKQK